MSLFRTKAIETDLGKNTGLKRSLNAFDLTMLGVGAIIGAGIFVLTGVTAATHSGPAIVLSFVLAGVACACAALSYAEMAASVGGAGSAYGYGYATLGELPAWVICWMLICEYTVAVAAVSVGWSGYLNNGLQALGLGLPDFLLHGPFDTKAPGLINLPAALIILVLGVLLASGAKVSAQLNAIIVAIKLAAVALFIGVALFHLQPALWSPFIPPAEIDAATGVGRFGWQGIVDGASTIFFAYLGFDAVSTAAEETRNPQRDLPIGILGSLTLCTVLYILVSGLLTGIVPYRSLNVDSPVSFALLQIGQNWAAGLISIGAVAGLTTVMLVMFFGQTRVLMAVSRDGLLPRFLSTVNPATGSPTRSIMISGAAMLLLGGFVPLNKLAELANIGTLGAFVVVCVGVIVLRNKQPNLKRPFKVPLYPLVPALGVLLCGYLMVTLAQFTWIAFGIWLVIGLFIYFGYSRSNSLLATAT